MQFFINNTFGDAPLLIADVLKTEKYNIYFPYFIIDLFEAVS